MKKVESSENSIMSEYVLLSVKSLWNFSFCGWLLFFLGSFYSGVYNLFQVYLLDFVISFMVFIMVFVFLGFLLVCFLGGVIKGWGFSNKMLEFWCGVLPVLILVVQVFCSYGLIYYDGLVVNNSNDFVGGSKLDIKVLGRQWFWVYEYSGLGDWMKFDSYLLGSDSMGLGDLRMLEVDNRLILPVGYYNRVSVTSGDVIHSWFMPFYGFKLDALPGLVNVHLLRFDSVGVFYGMCSEICGAGHSYMPIVVEVVPDNVFFSWLEDLKHKYDIVTRLGDLYGHSGVVSFF